MSNKSAECYVICRYINNKVKFMTDAELCDLNWSYDSGVAKRYIDLSAAEVKTANLRYGYHAVHAVIRFMDKDGILHGVRRSRYGGR